MARVVQDGDGLGEPIGASKPDHIGDGVAGRKEFAELRDTAPVQIGLFDDLWSTRVSDVERQSGHQEACLPGAVLEVTKRQLSVVEEDLPVGPVRHPCAGRTLRHPTDLAEAIPGRELRRGPGPVERPRDAPAE